MKGKSAIVTGSTSGIGLGIARALAAAGVNVMLNGFGDAADIETQRSAIETDFGVQARYHPADMSAPAQIADLIDAAGKEFGAVEIVVNNAGIQHTAPIETFPVDRYDAIVAINQSSVFHMTRLALPGMKARGWGRIINVASVHGLVASEHKIAYVAAKHAVVGMTKVTALECAGTGITCNAICPGWVRTALVEKQIDALAQAKAMSKEEAAAELLGKKQPSRRFVEVSELGALAVFLASDAASSITGAALPVDGGWTAI